MAMIFDGRFRPRSSRGPSAGSGPPGEAEIQRLNPGHSSSILAVTGWKSLAPGSLNLVVEHSIVEGLAELESTWQEPASGIVYPPPYQGIPNIRRGYWYYSAIARKGGVEEEVLVRRAVVPVPGIVELFSVVPLIERFKLIEDDLLTVEVRARRKAKSADA